MGTLHGGMIHAKPAFTQYSMSMLQFVIKGILGTMLRVKLRNTTMLIAREQSLFSLSYR